jgi:prepilin-type N-terminal cleavage/methylation domain-containing protein
MVEARERPPDKRGFAGQSRRNNTDKRQLQLMKMKTSCKSGFTLVEIMIVVSIIGLCAAIGVPNAIRSRMTSTRTACINNLRQLDSAVQQWALETGKGPTSPVADADVVPYLHNSVVCPAGGTSLADSYALTVVGTQPTCLRVPLTHALN